MLALSFCSVCNQLTVSGKVTPTKDFLIVVRLGTQTKKVVYYDIVWDFDHERWMHWRTTEINLPFYDENAPKGQRLKQSFSMLKIVIKVHSICVKAHLENQNRSRWISRDLFWYAVWETILTYVLTLAFHVLWALNWTIYELPWLNFIISLYQKHSLLQESKKEN